METSEFMEFGFGAGDENLGGEKFDRFKAKEGDTHRISFVWWPIVDGKLDLDAESPRFIAADRLHIPNVGYVLDKGHEFRKLAEGTTKPTVATVIALWPTDRNGALDKARFADGDVDVKPWVFARAVYEQLKRRHIEHPFGRYDLNIACTNAKFQKMDLSTCRESLFRTALGNEKLRPIADKILAKTLQILGLDNSGKAVRLLDMIARDLSLDQIRQKLGMPTEELGTPYAKTTNDIDAMLGDILDEM